MRVTGRAIGARPKDILQQILSESMVMTTVAGMAGISFAVLILQDVYKRQPHSYNDTVYPSKAHPLSFGDTPF